MIRTSAFVGRFLGAFAALVLIASVSDLPARYGRMLRVTASVVTPVLTGWWMEVQETPRGAQILLRRGNESLPFGFSLEKFALGLFPLLSLFAATPGLGVRRGLGRALGACVIFFLLDLLVVLLYPVLVRPGIVTDIAGTFLGLLVFVGAPVILWFALTFDCMRAVWRFELPPPSPSGK